jgi:exopolysaccharide biosynthesis polyprenyl glycosylphosphotransferase
MAGLSRDRSAWANPGRSDVPGTSGEPRSTVVDDPAVTGPAAAGPGRTAEPFTVPDSLGWQRRYLWTAAAADAGVALLAGAVAFGVRFGHVTAYSRSYLLLTVLFPVAWMLALLLSHAYERRFLFIGNDEYRRVLNAGIGLTAALAVLSYAGNVQVARGYVVVALPLVTLAGVAARFALRRRLFRLRRRGECMRRVVVLGYERAAANFCRQLRRERYHGMEIVGACLPPHRPHRTRISDVGVEVFGTFDDVDRAVRATRADTVAVLACPEMDSGAMRRLSWALERTGTDLVVATALLDVAGPRTTIRPVDGLPMLHVEHAELSGSRRLLKGLFDRLLAVLILLVAGPLLAVLAVLVRRDTPGPALFRQVRVGKDGREFVLYKLRTMYADAEQRQEQLNGRNELDGVLFKMRDDPRITPVGRTLRRYSLDELPQLLNVLRGQMSLVGPRPPLPCEVAQYPADVRRRLVVKPGLTGLWQVSGRSDLSWEDSVRLDLRYVENWSLTFDLVILLRTVTALVRTSGAY